jgi:hypothetical protein
MRVKRGFVLAKPARRFSAACCVQKCLFWVRACVSGLKHCSHRRIAESSAETVPSSDQSNWPAHGLPIGRSGVARTTLDALRSM